MILLLNKKQFGYSSEKTPKNQVLEHQLKLDSLGEDEAKYCPWCKTEMVPIGKEQVRQELQFIHTQLKITNYVDYAYECLACKKEGESVIEK